MTWPQHIVGRAVWLIAGLVLASAAWRAFSPTQPDKADAWLKVGDKYRWTVRGVLGQVVTSDARNRRLAQDTAQLRRSLHETQGQIENLVRSVDSLHRAPLTAAARRFGEACGEAINNCEQRVQVWRQRDSLHLALYELAAPRLGQADSIIAANQKAGQCRWLLFKCPSRTTVAEVVFVLGVGAGVALTR